MYPNRRRRSKVGAYVASDADALAVINAAEADGTSLNNGRRVSIETAIAGMKTDGTWTKTSGIWVYNYTKLVNWKSGLVQGSLVSAPAWDATDGYTLDAVDDEIDTAINPTTDLIATQNSVYFYVVYLNATANAHVAGQFDGTDGFDLLPTTTGTTGNAQFRINQANATTCNTVGATTASWCISRTGVNTTNPQKNGIDRTQSSSGNQTSTAFNNANLKIGGWNSQHPGGKCRVFAFGGGLTSAEQTAVNTRLGSLTVG
jgi:hypothetical protein